MRRRSAYAAIALAAAALVLLAALHVVSPEFDPSWRVVSEYADGSYGWVLTLMFACWAGSSWALAFAVSPQLRSRAGRAGLWILVVAGFGQMLAAAFDINQPLHGLSDLLGALGLPIAAMLVSIVLGREQPGLKRGKLLLVLANLTWISIAATVAGAAVLFVTFVHAGGHIPAGGKPLPLGTVLPSGVITFVGYANRLYVVVSCVWAMLLGLDLARSACAPPSNPGMMRRSPGRMPAAPVPEASPSLNKEFIRTCP